MSGTLVTGSGPHSGSHDGEPVDRLPFKIHTISRVHGTLTMIFLAATVFVAWQLRPHRQGTQRHEAGVSVAAVEATNDARHDLTTVLTVLVAQAGIGYTQYLSGVPALLVVFHVAGVTLLWITVVRFALHCGSAGALRSLSRRSPRTIGAASLSGVAIDGSAVDTGAHGTDPEPSRRR